MSELGRTNGALSSALSGGGLRDLIVLTVGLKANRLHPTIYLPVGKMKL
jgi:hypothetical protein